MGPLIDFLATAMDKPRLYPMADPLARINVMAYRTGEALNWHFDRAEFTTTLLLQAPVAGGRFEYRRGLRSAADPNYEGVGRLLAGEDRDVRILALAPGTLNVFKGRNTAHRVSPVEGERPRVIAVFSYYETPDVSFCDEERLGFYGRNRSVRRMMLVFCSDGREKLIRDRGRRGSRPRASWLGWMSVWTLARTSFGVISFTGICPTGMGAMPRRR